MRLDSLDGLAGWEACIILLFFLGGEGFQELGVQSVFGLRVSDWRLPKSAGKGGVL